MGKKDIQGTADKTTRVFGRVPLGKKSSVKASTFRGPVVIGDNSRVINSSAEYSAILNSSSINNHADS